MSSNPRAPNNHQNRWAAYCCGTPLPSLDGAHPAAPPPVEPRCVECFDNRAVRQGRCHVCFRRLQNQ